MTDEATRDGSPSLSIIVPAHNEATRGFPVLATLIAASKELNALVVVVCNGCTDDTADLARSTGTLMVDELPQASKAAALNAGDEIAGDVFPRFYLDADVHLDVQALSEIATALKSPGSVIAGPTISYVLDGAPWVVRRYYAALAEVPFLVKLSAEHMIGRGLYAINAMGRQRFDRFPAITADDGFVDRMFDREERHVVASASAGIPVPTTTRGFFRAKARGAAGTKELVSWLIVHRPDRLDVADTLPDPRLSLARRVQYHVNRGVLSSSRPAAVVDLVVYVLVEAIARMRVTLSAQRGPWR